MPQIYVVPWQNGFQKAYDPGMLPLVKAVTTVGSWCAYTVFRDAGVYTVGAFGVDCSNFAFRTYKDRLISVSIWFKEEIWECSIYTVGKFGVDACNYAFRTFSKIMLDGFYFFGQVFVKSIFPVGELGVTSVKFAGTYMGKTMSATWGWTVDHSVVVIVFIYITIVIPIGLLIWTILVTFFVLLAFLFMLICFICSILMWVFAIVSCIIFIIVMLCWPVLAMIFALAIFILAVLPMWIFGILGYLVFFIFFLLWPIIAMIFTLVVFIGVLIVWIFGIIAIILGVLPIIIVMAIWAIVVILVAIILYAVFFTIIGLFYYYGLVTIVFKGVKKLRVELEKERVEDDSMFEPSMVTRLVVKFLPKTKRVTLDGAPDMAKSDNKYITHDFKVNDNVAKSLLALPSGSVTSQPDFSLNGAFSLRNEPPNTLMNNRRARGPPDLSDNHDVDTNYIDLYDSDFEKNDDGIDFSYFTCDSSFGKLISICIPNK